MKKNNDVKNDVTNEVAKQKRNHNKYYALAFRYC